jgi:hypothetical protein
LLSLAVDDDRVAVTIEIAVTVAAALDHNGFVAIAVFTLADHFTISVAIAVAATNGNAYARRADTNAYPDVFRTRRHRN